MAAKPKADIGAMAAKANKVRNSDIESTRGTRRLRAQRSPALERAANVEFGTEAADRPAVLMQ